MKQFAIPKIMEFNGWEAAALLTDFSYPWQEKSGPKTTFSAYYDNDYIYFRFVASGAKPLVYVQTNHKLEVVHSERVEIFFRKDANMSPYYCLEMDPHGRVLDYEAQFYRQFNRDWQWPDSLAIQTKMDHDGYTLEGKLSLSTLKELGVLQNNQIQIGLFRGHCTKLEEKHATIQWMSWVSPQANTPDFHIPSSFGILKL